MSKKVRVLSLLFVVLFMFSFIFTGCGTDGAKSRGSTAVTGSAVVASSVDNTPGEILPRPVDYDVKKELQEYKDVMKITVFADYSSLQATKDDLYVKWALENLKVDASELEINASGSFADKVRTKVATNDLPDVIWGFDMGLFRSIAAGGSFLATDDLVNNYMPRVKDFVTQEIIDKYKDPSDGKLYIVPGYTIPPKEISKWWVTSNGPCVNMDLLAQTGLEVPKTPDELYSFLKAVAKLKTAKGKKVIPMAYNDFLSINYANTNYPMGGSITSGNTTAGKYLQHMFDSGSDYGFAVKNDDTKMIDTAYDRPSYGIFLKYFSRMYREGLLDKDNFTMSQDQYKERLKDGRYAFVNGNTGDATIANNTLTGTVIKPYTPVPFIKDPSITGSAKSLPVQLLGIWYTLINKNVKDPVRLAKYMEWQYTLEGRRLVNYGAPDKTKTINNWYYDDGGNVVIDMPLMTKWDSEKYGWEWEKAGGWGIHALGIHVPLKYTAVNEMGVNMADDFYKALDNFQASEETSDPAMEATFLQPKGPWFEKSGPALADLLNKWEVKIILSAKSDEDVDKLYKQMMAEARAVGYDDMKRELYELYLKANKSSKLLK